jgi:hypothetical protein
LQVSSMPRKFLAFNEANTPHVRKTLTEDQVQIMRDKANQLVSQVPQLLSPKNKNCSQIQNNQIDHQQNQHRHFRLKTCLMSNTRNTNACGYIQTLPIHQNITIIISVSTCQCHVNIINDFSKKTLRLWKPSPARMEILLGV